MLGDHYSLRTWVVCYSAQGIFVPRNNLVIVRDIHPTRRIALSLLIFLLLQAQNLLIVSPSILLIQLLLLTLHTHLHHAEQILIFGRNTSILCLVQEKFMLTERLELEITTSIGYKFPHLIIRK